MEHLFNNELDRVFTVRVNYSLNIKNYVLNIDKLKFHLNMEHDPGFSNNNGYKMDSTVRMRLVNKEIIS